jgi:hypothetical protein
MKNITLTADEHLIETARRLAKRRHTTLNAEFRRWPERYAEGDDSGERRIQDYRSLMDELADVSSGGRTFSRDELNER